MQWYNKKYKISFAYVQTSTTQVLIRYKNNHNFDTYLRCNMLIYFYHIQLNHLLFVTAKLLYLYIYLRYRRIKQNKSTDRHLQSNCTLIFQSNYLTRKNISPLKSHHQKLYYPQIRNSLHLQPSFPFNVKGSSNPLPISIARQRIPEKVARCSTTLGRILSHKLHRSRRSVKSSKPVRSSAQIKLVCNASRMPVHGATRHCPRVAGIVFILIYSLRSRVSSRVPRWNSLEKRTEARFVAQKRPR